MNAPPATPAFSLLGTTALLFEAPGAFDLEAQQRIWALAKEAEAWPEIREAVPGMKNLMLTFVEPPQTLDALRRFAREAGAAAAVAHPAVVRMIDVDVSDDARQRAQFRFL